MDMIASIHKSLIYVARLGVYPEWHPTLFRLGKRFGKPGLAKTFEFSGKQITDRLAATKKGESDPDGDDFLARVLRQHDADPTAFPMEKVFLTCLQNIGAGTDTTSVSLTAILWYLITSPGPLAKVSLCVDLRMP